MQKKPVCLKKKKREVFKKYLHKKQTDDIDETKPFVKRKKSVGERLHDHGKKLMKKRELQKEH